MTQRTDVIVIKNDLAQAIVQRNDAFELVKNLEGELREARRIAVEIENSPAQRFQQQRDYNKVNPFDEIAQ
jgi:F0F1-type ATP synthase membrane subunit b/b'